MNSQCPCGQPRKKGHIVCIDCWTALDYATQADLRSTSRTLRPAATRKALEFARTRSKLPAPRSLLTKEEA